VLSFMTHSAYKLSCSVEIDLLIRIDSAVAFWTDFVTSRPYALDPDLVAHIRAY
jgi:hypothetical protein